MAPIAPLKMLVAPAAKAIVRLSDSLTYDDVVSVNIFFTIFTNVFSPIAPTRMRRIRQRGCAAFGV